MPETLDLAPFLSRLDSDGFVLLPAVFAPGEVASITDSLARAFSGADPAIRGDDGRVYAARNVLDLWPGCASAWRKPPLTDLLRAALGPRYGLVRVLFFDKPPGHSWALPWHKDLTIAVRDNTLPTTHFRNPTSKAGIPHAEAPREVLDSMLTARVHLDAVTPENGPLRVLPGSHATGKELALAGTPHSVLSDPGDVLLIRPLVAHASGRSLPGTARHRRTLHLEFASSPDLPGGYAWHTFLPGEPAARGGDR
jgi:hypothetical protein